MHPVDASQEAIGQVDAVLAKFPGPVTLHITLNRRLVGLVFGIGGLALFIWFWITPGGYRASYWYMEPLGILFFAGFTIRAVILLIFPSCASLTLDADGFEIGHIFYRIRRSWQEVSTFRVETRYIVRYGPHPHVMYDVLDGGTARRRAKKKIVPEAFGRPRLHGEVLAWLMNEWRQRALALPPETSVPVVPRAS